MVIEGSILVGIVGGTIAGTIVWLGQEFVKFIVYQCNKHNQTRETKRTLNDLHGCLIPRVSRDDHQYNTLFGFESKLEGLVRYANAIDHNKKVDIHGVIRQIASVLSFLRYQHLRIPEHGSENDRSYLNICSNDLELIKREIESIGWLDITNKK